MVNGHMLVENGKPLYVETDLLVQAHNQAARQLLQRAGKA